MPDEHQRIPLLRELHRLDMHFGHQGACRIDYLESALKTALANRRRHTVRAVDHAHTHGYIVDIIDEDCALFGQLIYNKSVMNDLFSYIDGSPEGLKRDFNHIDRANYAGAKPARLQQENTLFSHREILFAAG